MTLAIVSANSPVRSELTDELDRIREVRTAHKLNEVQREMNETILTLT